MSTTNTNDNHNNNNNIKKPLLASNKLRLGLQRTMLVQSLYAY